VSVEDVQKNAQNPKNGRPNVPQTWLAKNRVNSGPNSQLRPKSPHRLSPGFPELGEKLTEFVGTW
jgi:hypothetical protein